MDQVEIAIREAQAAAAEATNKFLKEHGDRDLCGFAWVKVYEKGSTKMGRALLKAGFSKAYSGGLEWWNPSRNPTQCITAKEEGARAAARVLTERLGVKAYAGSRLD